MRCRLNEIKNEQGWTQKWLAEKVGISSTSMSAIINGESIPKLKIALRIGKIVGKPVEEIWIEENE